MQFSKNTIKELVEQNEISEAIEIVKKSLLSYMQTFNDNLISELFNATIINSSKYNQLQEEIIFGITNPITEKSELSNIKYTLLKIIDNLPDKIFKNANKQKGISKNEHNANLLMLLSEGEKTDDIDKKIIFFEKALELNNNNPDILCMLGIAYYKKSDKHIDTFRFKSTLHHEISSSFFMQVADKVTKSFINAKEVLKKSVLINSINPLSLFYLSKIESVFNHENNAISLLEQVISIKKEFHEAYYELGIIYKSKNDEDKALSFFEKAIDANQEYAEAYNQLGEIYQYIDIEKGKFFFKKAIELKSNFVEASDNLRYINSRVKAHNLMKDYGLF